VTGDDNFLNGRVIARQSATGFRSGLDAVMLAAAVPARSGDDVLELGAGAGVASLCLTSRVRGCRGVAVEIDPLLAELARENANANRAPVAVVCADIFALPAEIKRDFAHVFCNPPFHQGEASPDPVRDRALRDDGRLRDWLELGLKRTASGGTFTTILRADRLGEALGALPARGVTVLPLWPRECVTAKRVIVQAVKGSGAALALTSGLVLHDADGRYTAAADAILRGSGALVF
jgi:tRNA1(Val) A37 N6-methylase TrmN6